MATLFTLSHGQDITDFLGFIYFSRLFSSFTVKNIKQVALLCILLVEQDVACFLGFHLIFFTLILFRY